MLQARSERRVRRGEPALDIDAEVAKLMTPAGAASEVARPRIRGSPKRYASWWSRATNGARARALSRWTSRRRWRAHWLSWEPEQPRRVLVSTRAHGRV